MSTQSLKQVQGFTDDPAARSVDAEAFDPTKVDFGTLQLVPWARVGLSAKITGTDGSRAVLNAAITLTADTGDSRVIAKSLALYGPGDVIGIDRAQVIRREPAPGTVVSNGGTLAHVEFDKPELPWAYSPVVPAGERLRPWIALVVVEAHLARLTEGSDGLPPTLTVPASELTPLEGAWAWAHSQAAGVAAGGPPIADRLSDAHGAQNLSRLICPRRLEDNRHYLACIVPTFACGRDVGLGKDAAAGLGDAWPLAGGGDVSLPVYDSWTFATAEAVDFEALARRLKPVPAPAGIGRRRVDIGSAPGAVQGAPNVAAVVDCALHSPMPVDGVQAWPVQRGDALRARVNAAAKAGDTLPLVSPRLYAQFQRGQRSVSKAPGDWFDMLNSDPAGRIPAGIGTRVVREEQERMMEAAWAQVGEVNKANMLISAIQFARFVGEAMVNKTLARTPLSTLALLTAPVQGKMPLAPGKTVAGEIRQSALPYTAVSAAFRRATAAGRPAARVTARLTARGTGAAPFAQILGAGQLADLRRTYRNPDGIAALSPGAAGALTGAIRNPAIVNGIGRLSSPVDRLLAGGARVSTPVDILERSARLRGDALARRIDTDVALTPAMREGLGGMLAVAVAAAPAAITAQHDVRFAAIAKAVPDTLTPARVPLSEPIGRGGAPFGRTIPPVGPVGPLIGRVTVPPIVVGRGIPAGRGGDRPSASPGAAELAAAARDRFVKAGGGRSPGAAARRPVDPAQFADALRQVGTAGRAILPTPTRSAPAVGSVTLLSGIAPVSTATRYAKSRITLPAGYGKWFDDGQVRPVMAAPRFDRPMYRALLDHDPEWLAAGLDQIDETDFVTLLVSNPRFIESFMTGLSDEFGRELLWRGYPTDQRGTYFRRFWSAQADELTDPIHRWKRTALGSHFAMGGAAGTADGQERVVLLIRGQLIRKLPHALVVATQGTGTPPSTTFAPPPGAGTGAVLFRAALDADTLLVGFDLTRKQIEDMAGQGTRWWFLIAEHPTAPRFGLDTTVGQPLTPDNLEWGDLPMTLAKPNFLIGSQAGPFGWGGNAARNANLMLQKPIRVAFDAARLMKPDDGKGGTFDLFKGIKQQIGQLGPQPGGPMPGGQG